MGGLALTYGLTALAGVWAAYDRPVAWARFTPIALGLGLLLLLAWAGGRWGQSFLGPLALGCAGMAGAIGAYYLLGAEWQTGAGAKLPALQQVGTWVQAHRPVVALPEDIHPNVAGGLLAILLPFAAGGCAWAWLRARRTLALAGGLAVLLGIAAVVLTMSRGAWLGLAAAAVLALGWSLASRVGRSAIGAQRSRSIPLRMLLTAALVMALALPLLFALVNLPLADRLFGSVAIGSTAIGRTTLWRDAWALIGDYPFTGSGLGMTAMVYSTYALLIHAPYLDHMHSLLLQIAVEQGVLGAVLFAALLGGAVWATAGGRRQPQGAGQPQGLPLRVAALAALVALAVHGAVDAGVFVSKAAPVLFLPLGVAYGAWRKDEGGGRKDEGGIFHPSSFSFLLPPSSSSFCLLPWPRLPRSCSCPPARLPSRPTWAA